MRVSVILFFISLFSTNALSAQGTKMYNEAGLEDFEYIVKSGEQLDVSFGAVANQFFGNASDYLAFGGGMKVDILYTGRNVFIFGLNMSFYGNELKQHYPIASTREQNSAPPTLLVGVSFGKSVGGFQVLTELDLAVRNVTEKASDNDPDWVQFRGWSPGLTLNYPIILGKEKPRYYYGTPRLLSNNINLHVGFKYINLDLDEASGLMAEVGLSYRLSIKGIKEYKLK